MREELGVAAIAPVDLIVVQVKLGDSERGDEASQPGEVSGDSDLHDVGDSPIDGARNRDIAGRFGGAGRFGRSASSVGDTETTADRRDDELRPNRVADPMPEPGFSASSPTPRPSPWHLRVMPDALDRLREHPMFALHGEATEDGNTDSLILAPEVSEADREPTYRLELLRMFRQRMQLVTTLGLFIVPLFALCHVYLATDGGTREELLATHGLMLLLCVTLRGLTKRADNLLWARMLSLIGYALFSMASAVIVTQTVELEGNEFLMFIAYHQLLLTILLLPFTEWESLVVSSIIIGSLAWSSWMSAPPERYPFYSWHIVALCVTALFMLCVAYFQTLLRRQAFNSAFDLARSAAQLQALTVLDELTGGFNRRHLEKVVGIEMARAVRFSRPLSIIMFDLDNFKYVNDTHGHAAGDDVLREVWWAAVNTVREIDTVARYGGDEFTIVLPEAEETAARGIAERLVHLAAERLGSQYDGPKNHVSISAGVLTVFPHEIVPVSSLLHWADERLYEAKRSGKNCIVSSTIHPD